VLTGLVDLGFLGALLPEGSVLLPLLETLMDFSFEVLRDKADEPLPDPEASLDLDGKGIRMGAGRSRLDLGGQAILETPLQRLELGEARASLGGSGTGLSLSREEGLTLEGGGEALLLSGSLAQGTRGAPSLALEAGRQTWTEGLELGPENLTLRAGGQASLVMDGSGFTLASRGGSLSFRGPGTVPLRFSLGRGS
jgi:hypothetical protein